MRVLEDVISGTIYHAGDDNIPYYSEYMPRSLENPNADPLRLWTPILNRLEKDLYG